jgi:uncharacterized SAM-binding protein YcdF (DUF218 family)
MRFANVLVKQKADALAFAKRKQIFQARVKQLYPYLAGIIIHSRKISYDHHTGYWFSSFKPLYLHAMTFTNEVLTLAKKIWDYHHVNHTLAKADAILTLGSHDTRVAERAAELYHQGWAPFLIFAGGLGRLTEGLWTETEADLFARIAAEKGVPAENILIENRSTNTGENIQFVRQLLHEKGLHLQTFIVVQKPYMERRALATFEKAWPGKQFVVTSPQISFEEYPNADITPEQVINIMVGDLQRIKIYPEKGFQSYQEIPPDVWQAYEKLVAQGFNKQLI